MPLLLGFPRAFAVDGNDVVFTRSQPCHSLAVYAIVRVEQRDEFYQLCPVSSIFSQEQDIDEQQAHFLLYAVNAGQPGAYVPTFRNVRQRTTRKGSEIKCFVRLTSPPAPKKSHVTRAPDKSVFKAVRPSSLAKTESPTPKTRQLSTSHFHLQYMHQHHLHYLYPSQS